MNKNSYIDWTSMSDKALIETIGKFIQHHRLNQNKTQDDVAKAANISRSTLSFPNEIYPNRMIAITIIETVTGLLTENCVIFFIC